MDFLLSGEIYADTGIAELNHKYIDYFMGYFKSKAYSPELKRIFAIFVCRPGGPFKQRKKFDSQKGVFMVDIMLDYSFVMSATAEEKEVCYFESIRQIYPILEKHKTKIKDLKFEEFKKDLEVLLNQFEATI